MKKNTPFVAALFFGIIFVILLGVKTGSFTQNSRKQTKNVEEITEKNTWLNIYQNDKKIGYSHRVIHTIQDGYAISESSFMKINMMGMVEDISFETNGELTKDFLLTSFNFELKSSLFEFNVYGIVKDKTLITYIKGQKSEIPLENDIHLSSGFIHAVWEEGIEAGQTKTVNIFDPSTMGQKPVKISWAEKEKIKIMGKKISATKILIDFMGAKQTAWLDKNGEVVREEGFMGISLQKVSRYEALDKIPGKPDEDITKSVAVSSNVQLENSDRLSLLKIQLSGYGQNLGIAGGRQTFENDILTIRKETVLDKPFTIDNTFTEFLSATPFIQSNHPEIKTLVNKIVAKDDTPLQKTHKLIAWINDNIEKRPVLSVPSALDILENKMGDCNEHAVLLCALARAAGIPTKIEAGLVYMKGKFYYHAWNLLFLSEWITCDATMNQLPADVTHIRLVTGGTDKQIDLISIIGKIKLTILEHS